MMCKQRIEFVLWIWYLVAEISDKSGVVVGPLNVVGQDLVIALHVQTQCFLPQSATAFGVKIWRRRFC